MIKVEFKSNTISKDDFFSINEDDVMFITNPGRMGDEDGSTFILKEDDVFKIYRLDGWMYRSRDFNESEHISLNENEELLFNLILEKNKVISQLEQKLYV